MADSVVAILENPATHRGPVYELTGPEVLDMHGLAEQFGRALGRRVTARDDDYDEWVRSLDGSGLDAHVRQHIATMAQLHREDRYNRATDTVTKLTGHPACSVEQYVRAKRDLFR